jgi:hypothetical protein
VGILAIEDEARAGSFERGTLTADYIAKKQDEARAPLERELKQVHEQAAEWAIALDDCIRSREEPAMSDEGLRLAATPPAPALDVERLARAMEAHDDSGSGLTPYYWHLQAVTLAREYAALAQERQETLILHKDGAWAEETE